MALHCLQLDPAVAVARRIVDWFMPGDAVLLLGPGVALAGAGNTELDSWLAHGISVHALDDDLALHGIDATDARIAITDYAGWVALTVAHPQQLTWI